MGTTLRPPEVEAEYRARFATPPVLWVLLVAWSLAWVVVGAFLSAAVQFTRPPDYLLPVMSDMRLVLIEP